MAALRSDADTILQGIEEPARRRELLTDLVHAAELRRGGRERDSERIPSRRAANLDRVSRGLKTRGLVAAVDLSPINKLALLPLSADESAESIIGRIELLRDRLPRTRRGRPDDDSLVIMGVAVAQAYRRHFGRNPSSAKDSTFTFLLECVAKVADGRRRRDLHTLAEQVVGIRVTEYGAGVTTYLLPRFDKKRI